MHKSLQRLDLNLLLVFDALYRHGSVSAAANELALSPSALSHALARLRDTWADELFVRQGNRMQATARAQQLATVVSEALAQLENGLAHAEPFNPAITQQTLVLAATDYTAFALLRVFMAPLLRAAPGLRLRVVYSSGRDSYDELLAGSIDFALGFSEDFGQEKPGLTALTCYREDYVVVLAKHHPQIQGAPTLAQYLQARHMVVTPWNETQGLIDKVLAEQGHTRQIAVQLPSLMAAPFLVGSSELLITLPRHAAETLCSAAEVALYPLPFTAPTNVMKIFYSNRNAKAALHVWVRAQIVAALDDYVPSLAGLG